METSPSIQETVIADFRNKFSGREGSEARRRYDQLKKPDICDTIISANETRHKWYLELDKDVDEMNNDLTDVAMQQKNNVIQEQRRLLAERETELIEKAEFEKKSVYINERINHINLYVKNFINVYERKPLRDEIIDNLNNEVETEVFDIFFASYNSLDSV